MKTPMTREIQAVILAVQTYRRFLTYDNEVHSFAKSSERLFGQILTYFCSIPLPDGLKHCPACLEAILHYPIAETYDTPMEQLPENYSFGY